jgi:predicted RND superfamily exporter protein
LLAGGFPVLMLASLKTVFYLGLLTTVAALSALAADLLMLPLLLRAWPAGRRRENP